MRGAYTQPCFLKAYYCQKNARGRENTLEESRNTLRERVSGAVPANSTLSLFYFGVKLNVSG